MYWISTSKLLKYGIRSSFVLWSIALRNAAHSNSSKLCVGTKWMVLVAPGRCPERPARCTNRLTPLGDPICTTQSTGRKSTPKSKEDVQTTALRLPSYNASSTQFRTCLEMALWCIAITPAKEGSTSNIFWYQISAWARVLVKMSVLWFSWMSGITFSSNRMPKWPAHGKVSTSSGNTGSTTSDLLRFAFINWADSAASTPINSSKLSSILPMVALIPQVFNAGRNFRNLERNSSHWTARLVPISSCHSSITTVSKLRNNFA